MTELKNKVRSEAFKMIVSRDYLPTLFQYTTATKWPTDKKIYSKTRFKKNPINVLYSRKQQNIN